MSRQRLDALLAERGNFPSRTAAAAAVRAGEVQLGADGPYALKPSQLVDAEVEVIVAGGRRYVSRGGLKLSNALDDLGVEAIGRDCLDVGASTGGFTDCLLQRGAARVIAVDVGHGELDWGLRNDPRVTVLERLNARELSHDDLPFAPSLATIDVSFISLTKVLPAVAAVLDPGGEVLAMVKPQFELGPDRVGKRGVVRDPGARREALRTVAATAASLGLAVRGIASSGLPGPKGNRETFICCARSGSPLADVEAAIAEVDA
jgi:23S rRNA (cytidine1920-2'-O)/16S rRNA (cytidine1409-2'-O)-methyltransferase